VKDAYRFSVALTLVPLLVPAVPDRALAEKRPNILILMTDQHFADAMSCRMGSGLIRTPAMDSLAASGMLFTRAYAANPLCMPSRTAMMTGRYPHETGIQHNGAAGADRSLPCISFGRLFRNAGYDTGYVGKWHVAGAFASPKDFEFSTNIRHKRIDAKNVSLLIEFIRRKRERPFLLVGSFCNPHNICEWARGQKLPDGDIGVPPPRDQLPPLVANHRPPLHETDTMRRVRELYARTKKHAALRFDEDGWRRYRWAYYRMIELVDHRIGRVLQALKDSGQEENTVVIYLSDHGDCFGAHGWDHKETFYDESCRVPLIIRWKGVTKAGVSDRLVNTGIDLYPTLCDYAGIEPPAGLPGLSLKGTANGHVTEDPRRYIVVQNKFSNKGKPEIAGQPMPAGRMVRSRRYKYCLYDMGNRRESLVDMERDPGETVNLAGDVRYKEILRQHRRYFVEWRAKYGDSFPLPPKGD